MMAQDAGFHWQELVPFLRQSYKWLRNNHVYGFLPQLDAILGFNTRRLNQLLL